MVLYRCIFFFSKSTKGLAYFKGRLGSPEPSRIDTNSIPNFTLPHTCVGAVSDESPDLHTLFQGHSHGVEICYREIMILKIHLLRFSHAWGRCPAVFFVNTMGKEGKGDPPQPIFDIGVFFGKHKNKLPPATQSTTLLSTMLSRTLTRDRRP